MKTMHLFAGAGGGLLGDLILGHEPIIAVEWDKYACQVLRERAADGWFPNLQVWEGDVRMFDPSEYEGRVDCIHAGFPCQDISVAGKQAGVGEETRSGLYREVLRIADVVRPRILFLENVAAILNNGLGTVLADLSARGYSARWICIRASDVGANHGRDRWWLLARKTMVDTESKRIWGGECNIHSANGRQDGQLCKQLICSSIKPENSTTKTRRGDVPSHTEHDRIGRRDQLAEGVEETQSTDCGRVLSNADLQYDFGRSESQLSDCTNWKTRAESCGCGSDVSNTYFAQCEGAKQSKRVQQKHADNCEHSWWEVEPDVGRVVNGLATRTHQLKALGNGQVPLQAAVAWRILGGE